MLQLQFRLELTQQFSISVKQLEERSFTLPQRHHERKGPGLEPLDFLLPINFLIKNFKKKKLSTISFENKSPLNSNLAEFG